MQPSRTEPWLQTIARSVPIDSVRRELLAEEFGAALLSRPTGCATIITMPTITAVLEDGPLEGQTVEQDTVEGRPPKTIDVRHDDTGISRYCLAAWEQDGRSAAYTFLYPI